MTWEDNRCELCGEPEGPEMGEFYDPDKDDGEGDFAGHAYAHAECGLNANLGLA